MHNSNIANDLLYIVLVFHFNMDNIDEKILLYPNIHAFII